MKTNPVYEACCRGDKPVLGRLGWIHVMDALLIWDWPLTMDDLAPYALLLGTEDAHEVTMAIREIAAHKAKYRPAPVEIYQHMHPPPKTADTSALAWEHRTPRPDMTPVAYAAVRLYIAAGQDVCECRPRSTNMLIDRDGVLWCPICGGLEVGQYDAAMEDEDAA